MVNTVVICCGIPVGMWIKAVEIPLLLKTFKALNGLLCADVLLRNYSPTHSMEIPQECGLEFAVCLQ